MSYYPYIFDINTYLKSDATMQALVGGVPKIYPLVGYEESESPFFLYWQMPGNVSRELFFVRCDYIRYHILDRDAARGMRISEQMLNVLNKGDEIQGLISSSSARVLWMVELRSGTGAFNAGLGAPKEREGFYEFQLIFEVGYVPLD
jgi:hypothetical protein